MEYEGHSILILDFSRLTIDGILNMIEEAKVVIHQAEPNSLRIISDFTDTHYDKQTADRLAEFTASNKPYVKASAVLGITGMKKVLYNVVIKTTGRKLHLANSREEALKWLVSQ